MRILAELTPLDPVAGNRITVRAASAQDRKITGLGDVKWRPAINVLPSLGMRLFDGDFSSSIEPGGASLGLRLDALERMLPDVRRYLWAGARLTIYAGESGDAWPWEPVFKGLVDRYEARGNGLSINAKVDTEPFEADALTLAYAGTGGLEGGADLKNKVKPWVFGRAANVEPVLINAVDNVLQFSAYGPIKAVTKLYERGSDFGASIGNFADYAALVAANIPAGRWGTCLAQGLVRLGAPPYGVITGDVEGDAPGGVLLTRTGAIIERVALNAGVSAALIDSASLDALDVAVPYDIDLFLTEQTTVLDLARRLARPCNAQAGVSWTGKLFTVRVAIGAPAITLDAQGRQKPPVSDSVENDVSPPYWRLEMGGVRSWRVHSLEEIAFTAPLVERGRYDDAETYREGHIVDIADGSRWLYTNPTPTAGNDPVIGSAFWTQISPPSSLGELPGTIDWGSQVGGSGKPDDNADVTGDNTAAFVEGQGPLATASMVLSEYLSFGNVNNLIPNGDFRTGDFTDWGPAYPEKTTVVSRSAAGVPAGADTPFVAKFVNGGTLGSHGAHVGSSSLKQGIAVKPGEQYLFAVDYAGVNVANGAPVLYAWWEFADGSRPGTALATLSDISATWKTKLASVTVPAGAIKMQAYLYWSVGGPTGTVYFTNVIVLPKVSGNVIQDSAVRLGFHLVRENGSTTIMDADAITALGTAAYLNNEGPWAKRQLEKIFGSDVELGTLTTDLMLLKAGNLVANGDFATGDFSNWALWSAASIPYVGAGAGGRAQYRCTLAHPGGGAASVSMFAAARAYSMPGSDKDGFAVKPGERFLVSVDAMVDTAFSGGFGIRAYFLTGDGNVATNISVISTSNLSTTWANSALFGEFTAPANAIRCWLYVVVNSWTAGSLLFTNLRCWKKTDFDLLTSDAVRIGVNLNRNDGLTKVQEVDVITTFGTASAVANQGALATKSWVDLTAAEVRQGLETLTPEQIRNSFRNGNVGQVPRPIGSTYSEEAAITGAIRIRLPITAGQNMVRFTVKIYNYANGTSTSYDVGGYLYHSGNQWLQTFAAMIGPDSMSRPVRFGYGSGYFYVFIGELNDSWSYPKVQITDFQVGYGTFQVSDYETGWVVNISPTAFPAINATYPRPRAGDAVFGDNLLEASGGVVATIPNFKTNQGTAAAITNQGALATKNTANMDTDVVNGSTYARIRALEMTDGRHKIGIAGSGVRVGDQRNLPPITAANLRYKYTQSPTYSATSTSATISLAAGTLYLGSASLALNAMSVAVSGSAGALVTYHLYINNPSYTGGSHTLIATTNGNLIYQNDAYMYLGSVDVVFPTSGSGSGGGTPGSGSCVHADAFVETRNRGFIRARDVMEGDWLRVLSDDREGTSWERVTGVEAADQAGYLITSKNGAELTASDTTPITLRDGSIIGIGEIDGHELPVLIDGFDLEWEPCWITPIGLIPVARIHVNMKTYAAGDVPGFSILTHNPAKP